MPIRYEAEMSDFCHGIPPVQASLSQLTQETLEAGLVTPAEIHQHGLVARNLSRSHAVAGVRLGDGRGYVVKDMHRQVGAEQGTPDQEQAVYRLIARHRLAPDHALTSPHVNQAALILPYMDGETVAARLHRVEGEAALLVELGQALACWHTECRPHRNEVATVPVPWILRATGTPRPNFLRTNSAVIAILDQIDVVWWRRVLQDVQARWQVETVIHGDVQLENCVVDSSGKVVLIDWECAGAGDPAWDVAAAAAEVVSRSQAGDAKSARPVLAGDVRTVVAAHADGYSTRYSPDWTLRVVIYLGCRLLQRALQLASRGNRGVADQVSRHVRLAEDVLRHALELQNCLAMTA